jgi:hypothetical protein
VPTTTSSGGSGRLPSNQFRLNINLAIQADKDRFANALSFLGVLSTSPCTVNGGESCEAAIKSKNLSLYRSMIYYIEGGRPTITYPCINSFFGVKYQFPNQVPGESNDGTRTGSQKRINYSIPGPCNSSPIE